jgi:hypothetical protein
MERYTAAGWPSDIRLLKVHHRTAKVIARTIYSTTEIIYDEHIKDFRYITSEYRDLLENSQIKEAFFSKMSSVSSHRYIWSLHAAVTLCYGARLLIYCELCIGRKVVGSGVARLTVIMLMGF